MSSVLGLRKALFIPEFLCDCVNIVELVGGGFVRSKDAKIVRIHSHHVRQHASERTRIFCEGEAWFFSRVGVIAEIRKARSFLEAASVGMRICAHAARAARRQFSEYR